MHMIIRFLAAVCGSIFLWVGPALAADVETVELKIGELTALGDLITPEKGSIEKGVVLMTHGTLAHKDMELMKGLQDALAERGVATLAHSLTLGVDKRTGMYDCTKPHAHKHADAVAEIDAWVKWLVSQGARKIVLLGHSRGGSQVARYAAEMAGDEIDRVVLLAPAMGVTHESAVATYRSRYKGDLDAILKDAADRVAKGQTELMSLPGLLYCPDAKVKPETVVSYYGEDPGRSTITWLPKIKKPVLVIAGAADTVVPDVPKRAGPFVDGERVRLEVIKDADHLFLDFFTDDAAGLIANFVLFQ